MKSFLLTLAFFVTVCSKAQSFAVKYLHFMSQEQPVMLAYVYEKAPASNGQTVLLLHGKNFSHSYWRQTISALNAKGYDVLAPDQIGFGMSTKPQHYQHSFQQCVLNTRQLLDSLGLSKVTVLGHSMGGMVATRFALMYPDLCPQLILENPIGLEDWKTMVPYTSVDEEFKKEKSKTKQQLKEYFIQNYFHGAWKERYEPVLNETAALSKSADSLAYDWNMALTSDMIFTQPVCYEFKNLKVPVTLIIGQADRTAIGREKANASMAAKMGNYPELGKKTAALIPNSRLIALKELGHIPHLEDFDAFIKSLEQALLH